MEQYYGIIYFVIAGMLFLAAISMYRYNKKLPAQIKKKRNNSKIHLTWWFLTGVFIVMLLTIGNFGEFPKLIGWGLFIVLLSVQLRDMNKSEQ